MIALIEGTVVEKSEGEAIVMTAGGVGYRLMCSMNTLSSLPAAGDKCRLYTHLNVREDAMELFGFCQKITNLIQNIRRTFYCNVPFYMIFFRWHMLL